MAVTLTFELITPEGIVHQGPARAVTLPVAEGEIQVLPGHIPLMTRLVAGAVEMHDAEGGLEHFAVGEGLARVTWDRVSLLTEMAINTDDVNEIEVEEARRRAEARLKDQLSAEEHASVSAALAHAVTKLRAKRRHGGP